MASSASGTPRAQNRACDRCKRRKQRCNFSSGASVCSNCQDSRERCVFDVPLGKRGPKSRRSRPLDAPSPNPPATVGSPGTPRSPTSRFSDLTTPTEPRFNLASPTVPNATTTAATTANLQWQAEPSAVSPQAALHLASVLQRWDDLSTAIQTRMPTKSLEAISRQCLDLFFEYVFPLTPLADEPSLREALEFFIAGAQAPPQGQGPTSSLIRSQPWLTPDQRILNPPVASGHVRLPDLWLESTFTWITAVCAETAFFLPSDMFPEGTVVAETFLQASRDCLAGYFESDLEQPSASSVAIRYFHSNCLHAVGKQRYSWHIFGEATRLAQVMNLHDEASYEGLSPVEAGLRRRAFWLVYIGDKSAALLNNRPITIHKFSFERGITTQYPSAGEGAPGGSDSNTGSINNNNNNNFVMGFNANLRLWQTAADVLLEMRLIRDRNALEHPQPAPPPQQRHPPSHVPVSPSLDTQPIVLTADDRVRLDNLNVRFATCLDDLPAHLLPDSLRPYEPDGDEAADPSPASHQPFQRDNQVPNDQARNRSRNRNQCAIQIANLQVSYHCLRMIMLQRFEDLGYFGASTVDHRSGVDLLLLRKTEIARDLLRIIREAPFWSLQVNGEPNVEKIRLVGASLLAIIHMNEASPLAARARRDFGVLLDILTRLDSKASDALREGTSWVL